MCVLQSFFQTEHWQTGGPGKKSLICEGFSYETQSAAFSGVEFSW